MVLGPGQLKKYIEANDVAWIDREVKIQKITFNPFTFNVGMQKVVVK